jgi:predicted secreted protein
MSITTAAWDDPAVVVCYLAHCLLNANAKVDEGARCAGVSMPVLSLLREHGATIRQMPCPELAFGGTRRFWAVREQYDTPAYRAHCLRLAEPVAAQVRADLAAGARVLILGIDGSPSMGVELTAADASWGGRPDKPRDEDYPVTPGAGLFTETLVGLLGEDAGAVRAVGIGQDLFDYDEERELAKLGGILSGDGEPGAR